MHLSAMKVSGSAILNGQRNLYLMELPARGLARVNGSDIERFYYNEDFVEKDSNDVVCEIFIPVRPV